MPEDSSDDNDNDNVFRLPINNGGAITPEPELSSSYSLQEENILQQPDHDPVEQKIWLDSMASQEQQLIAEDAGQLNRQYNANNFNEIPTGETPQEIEKQKREIGTRGTAASRDAFAQIGPQRWMRSTDKESFGVERIAA